MFDARFARRIGPLGLLALITACSGSDGTDAAVMRPDAAVHDAAVRDAGGGLDARVMDAAAAIDAGTMDAGGADAAAPDAARPMRVGSIMGTCGVLDDELTSPEPSTIQNSIDFPNGYSEADVERLSPGAQQILQEGTAGGSSGLSEAFAFEVLERCEGAIMVKSETAIVYDPPDSKKTDILVQIDGRKIGVSVTRAVAFPFDAPYSVERARDLLSDKLADILVSSANVTPEDAWDKQILHVIAYGPMHGESMATAAAMVAPEVRADTIVWITVTNGDDEFLY